MNQKTNLLVRTFFYFLFAVVILDIVLALGVITAGFIMMIYEAIK